MIKVVLWDLDGTLTNFKKAEINGMRNCFEKFKLGECTNKMIKDYSEINDRYWRMLERKEISKPDLLVKRFDEFFKLYNIKCNSKKFNIEYQEQLRQEVVLQTNAKKVVSSLKKLNIPQYVVTNGLIESQNKKIKKVKLDTYFENVFISDEIGYDKPTAEFFEPVFKEINEKYPDVKKDEILIIGDSLTSDIQGGVNTGIKTCWFNPDHKQSDLSVDYEVDKLIDILAIFEEKPEENKPEEKVVEKIVIESNKVTLKDVVEKNTKVVILGLAAISLLFICLFLGTNKMGGKTYTINEVFKCESITNESIKLPSNFYLSDTESVLKLEEDKLSVSMYGYLETVSKEEFETSIDAIKEAYSVEDTVCKGHRTLIIKDAYGQQIDGASYDFAYLELNDSELLCIGFINVDEKTELKILNSIK